MPTYRCYLLDEADHILRFETAAFRSDPEAIDWAKALCDKYPSYHAVELWSGSRKVWFQHCHRPRGVEQASAEQVSAAD